MSIKKGKKQVYKVECKHKFGNTVGNTWNNVLYGNCYLCNKTVKVSPLKPKKSKRHVHEYIPFDANAYPTLEKYAEYHQCKCGKEKPKKSIKKMYKVKRECDNCGEFYFVSIPFGTKKWDFFSEAASPKGKSIICKFCGC